MKERAEQRLGLVLSPDDMKRISLIERRDGRLEIETDVHGMNRVQAKRFLRNIVALIREPFLLIVIHGYNRGTVLKEMVRGNIDDCVRVAGQTDVKWNKGMTILEIAHA